MNTYRVAAALCLGLIVASPAFAGEARPPKGPGCGGVTTPVALAVAETAAAEAIERAKTFSGKISGVPVEYARLLVTIPYSTEPIETPANPDEKAIKAILVSKAAYWKAVVAALKAEGERLSDEIDEMSRNAYNGVDEAIARSMKLSRYRQAAELIVADIEADTAAIADPSKESGQAILDRKAALCRLVAAMKNPRD